MISALLLSTSLPMQVLAQSTPTDEWLNFVNDPREKWIAEKYASENNKYYLESGLTIFEDKTTGEIRFGGKTGVAPENVAFTQEQLREILNNPELTNKLFGEVDTYGKFTRVQAVQAKGGEEIVTVLADGTKETKNIAKAGDWIVTNPGGERYIVDGAKFTKKYEAAAELGEGWFKPKGAPQQFRQIKADMKMMASWGEEQTLRKGAYVNVTDINDLYGVAEQEFNDTYKTIKVLYRENFNGIQRFVSKIEERLYKRYPKYKGVFFRKFLKNDTKYMEKRLADKAAKQAAKNSGKKAVRRAALRTFSGVAVGFGVYMGLTLLSAPSVQAQNVKGKTHNQVISELEAEVNANAEKKNLFEKMRSFADENYAAVVITDAIEGNGDLLEEMGTVIPTVQATGLTEDAVADLIVDEAIDEPEYQLPFYNPFKGVNIEGISGDVSFN